MPDVLSDFATGGGAFNVAIYVIVSMTILVGITYLISKLMNNKKLEDWSKNEFMQVIISSAIVGALFLLMNPGSGIIIKLFNELVANADAPAIITGGPAITASGCDPATGIHSDSALCFANNYLTALDGLIGSVLGVLVNLIVIADMFAKFSIDIIIVEFSPFAGLSSFVQVMNTILQSLIFLDIVVGIEKALLRFIGITALNVFLPIGVILRSFFGTRKIGGALMALSIGLYIVFPLTIALNAFSAGEISQNEIDSITELEDQLKQLNFATSDRFSDTSSFADAESWAAYLGDYADAFSVDGSGSIIGLLMVIPNYMVNLITSLAVQIVFLPLLSVMLTLLSIKELANIFGSEINLSRFEV